jgi:hypothetical protein
MKFLGFALQEADRHMSVLCEIAIHFLPNQKMNALLSFAKKQQSSQRNSVASTIYQKGSN